MYLRKLVRKMEFPKTSLFRGILAVLYLTEIW